MTASITCDSPQDFSDFEFLSPLSTALGTNQTIGFSHFLPSFYEIILSVYTQTGKHIICIHIYIIRLFINIKYIIRRLQDKTESGWMKPVYDATINQFERNALVPPSRSSHQFIYQKGIFINYLKHIIQVPSSTRLSLKVGIQQYSNKLFTTTSV